MTTQYSSGRGSSTNLLVIVVSLILGAVALAVFHPARHNWGAWPRRLRYHGTHHYLRQLSPGRGPANPAPEPARDRRLLD